MKTPCEVLDLPTAEQDRLNEYCGFRKGFTKHDWCAHHYIGEYQDDGSIKPCPCECHKKRQPAQASLF